MQIQKSGSASPSCDEDIQQEGLDDQWHLYRLGSIFQQEDARARQKSAATAR